MSKGNKELKISQLISGLCKNKTEEELIEAEETLNEYLLIVKEFSHRMKLKGNGICRF